MEFETKSGDVYRDVAYNVTVQKKGERNFAWAVEGNVNGERFTQSGIASEIDLCNEAAKRFAEQRIDELKSQ